MKNKSLQIRLIVMNFLEFAVWGAYLTCMSRYLASHGMGANIGWFYSIQGVVSLFMPALMGIVADRWMQAQKALSLCHLLAGLFMGAAGIYALTAPSVQFAPLFTLYTVSVAFFMPTIALTNSVAFNALVKAGMDTVKDFPPIRVFGTIGFIGAMWAVDLLHFQDTPWQFVISGGLSLILAAYSLTLPACEIKKVDGNVDLIDALGLKAFALFKQKKMALFFIFSMLLGMCLQVTNSYANPFLGSFEAMQEYSSTFAVQHSNMLISISQICEALCILAIPFFLKRFGIKNVMSVGASLQNMAGNNLSAGVFVGLNNVENLILNAGYIYNNTDTDFIAKSAKNTISLSAGYKFQESGIFLAADVMSAISNEYLEDGETKKYENDGKKLIPFLAKGCVSYKAKDNLTAGVKAKVAMMIGDDDSRKTELYPNIVYTLADKMGTVTTGVRLNLDKDGLYKIAIPLSWRHKEIITRYENEKTYYCCICGCSWPFCNQCRN